MNLRRHSYRSGPICVLEELGVHVSNLRRKVEADPANPRRILTVRGAGYKLAAP